MDNGSTSENSLDYTSKYHNIYCGWNGARSDECNAWLGSPTYFETNNSGAGQVLGGTARLYNVDYQNAVGFYNPVVALKSEFTPHIADD